MKKRIYNDTFGFEVFVTDNPNHYPSNVTERAQAMCNIEPDIAYLYIRDATYPNLVHECIHIAQGILHHKGIKTDYKNTEVLAYVTDWLFEEILKILVK